MMRLILTCLALVTFSAHAEEVRVYQTDAYGNVQFHKPSLTVTPDGRVIQTDAYGKKQYHEQQYRIEGDKVYQADKYGNRLTQAYVVNDGKVYRTDKYGNRQQQVLEVQGTKVYATDKYGNRQAPKYLLKDQTTKPIAK